MILFVILVICVIPAFWMFNDFDGGDRAPHSFTSRMSIAQLGFAKALCKDTPLESGFLNLVCHTGEIRTIHDFGVIPEGAVVLDACIDNEETERCKSSYDEQKVNAYIEATCLNKREC